MKMRKDGFVKGLVSVVLLVVSIMDIQGVLSVISSLVPVSSMVGQEIFLIMPIFVAWFLFLFIYAVRFIGGVIAVVVTNLK